MGEALPFQRRDLGDVLGGHGGQFVVHEITSYVWPLREQTRRHPEGGRRRVPPYKCFGFSQNLGTGRIRFGLS